MVGKPLITSCDLGVNGKIVTDRLGHANETVTQQIYTHKSTWPRSARRRNDRETDHGSAEQAPLRAFLLQFLLPDA
jgi:integrase